MDKKLSDLNIVNVFLIKDSESFYSKMCSSLEAEHLISIAGQQATVNDAFSVLDNLSPVDVIFIDKKSTEFKGLDIIRLIKDSYPSSKIVVASDCNEVNTIKQIFNSGANGFLNYSTCESELLFALNFVKSGSKYISSDLSLNIISSVNPASVSTNSATLSFSKKEKEILNMVADGLTNREIAGKLVISTRTVECHRKNILRKTGSKNTAALIKLVSATGVI